MVTVVAGAPEKVAPEVSIPVLVEPEVEEAVLKAHGAGSLG